MKTIERLTPERLREFCRDIPGGLDLLPSADFLAGSGIAYAFLEDGVCFGFQGVFLVWSGVGEMWALMHPERFRFPVFVRGHAIEILREAAEKWRLHRIQSNADPALPYHGRWLESVGFESEGTMRQFTANGRDMTRFAMLPQETA